MESFDDNLLNSKVSSVNSHIQNSNYNDSSKKFDDARKHYEKEQREKEALDRLRANAKKQLKIIEDELKKVKKKEYEDVGPYLFELFRKLSRATNISDIKIDIGRGGKELLNITDENGTHILNRLSDGQLSVFMLSYFIGNIFRRRNVADGIKVYFIDDITSCMDDINMLAFLDFIKYQISGNDLKAPDNAAISQLFFSTCDDRIQSLLKYKLNARGIEYTQIDGTKFSSYNKF